MPTTDYAVAIHEVCALQSGRLMHVCRGGASNLERGLATNLGGRLLSGEAVLREPRLQRRAAPNDGERAQGELRAVAAADHGAPAQLAEGIHRQVMPKCHLGDTRCDADSTVNPTFNTWSI